MGWRWQGGAEGYHLDLRDLILSQKEGLCIKELQTSTLLHHQRAMNCHMTESTTLLHEKSSSVPKSFVHILTAGLSNFSYT